VLRQCIEDRIFLSNMAPESTRRRRRRRHRVATSGRRVAPLWVSQNTLSPEVGDRSSVVGGEVVLS